VRVWAINGKKFADETLFDGIGSVVFKKGNSAPKIMIAGHVDEIETKTK